MPSEPEPFGWLLSTRKRLRSTFTNTFRKYYVCFHHSRAFILCTQPSLTVLFLPAPPASLELDATQKGHTVVHHPLSHKYVHSWILYISKNLAFMLPDHKEISKQEGKYTDLSFASLSLFPLNLSAPSRIQKCQGLCTELTKPLPLHKAENVFQSDYQKKQMHAA